MNMLQIHDVVKIIRKYTKYEATETCPEFVVDSLEVLSEDGSIFTIKLFSNEGTEIE